MRFLRPALCAALTLAVAPARAWAPALGSSGPLSIEIAPMEAVEITSKPREVWVTVTLKNARAQPVGGSLEIELADGWKVSRPLPLVEGESIGNAPGASTNFLLAGNEARAFSIGVTPTASSYSALYPIHARARFTQRGVEVGPIENPEREAHAVLIVQARRNAPATPSAPLVLRVEARGATPLDVARAIVPRWELDAAQAAQGAPQVLGARPPGDLGTDETSGTSFFLSAVARPDARSSIAMHPPWRTRAGEAMADIRVALPHTRKLALSFATAIRDSSGAEPQSDGVQFRVLADAGQGFETLFDRFSDSKTWQAARVDLSKFAGQTISLRLQSGPGAARNTSVDQSYWGAPAIVAGDAPAPEPLGARAARRARALQLAREARDGKVRKWAWTLRSGSSSTCGAAIVPGRAGMRDAFVAFAGNGREMVFDGFDLALEGPDGPRSIGMGATELAPARITSTWGEAQGASSGTLSHALSIAGRNVTLRARVWGEKGALRIAWSLPGAARDGRGVPRIARVSIGAASQKVRRAYAGFGNVMSNPGRWTLDASGFRLSTRHVGADYANGLSLVQASDIFPDAFDVDGARGLASLRLHHDATLSLIPSELGAFAAARTWRALSGFRAGGGVSRLLGRVGLDQWGGDYAQAAVDLKSASEYGVRDAVFIKHVWQKWGYDYRLPDIYPPEGDQAAFQSMVRAAKSSGILFCPHDNYIDFYPDATGFSYRHIVFNRDGTPQRAWLNEGRGAQSYRWSPNAFQPFLERNLQLVKSGFAPNSYFVDVFSAIAPFDFYDQAGRFYSQSVTQQKWGAAFDRMRRVLGGAPTISEAGVDALIGHLDGAQSDHGPWIAPGTPRPSGNDSFLRWELEASDGERVPWHDMATHGRMVLFAGGLGGRYAAGMDERLHSWGSDDYLSMTVLGGRAPMSDGPFSRRSVMTYWLLHDISALLARSEMTAHRFHQDDIHRQIVSWQPPQSPGAKSEEVFVNRGARDWSVRSRGASAVLPRYGFWARVGSGNNEVRADISRRGGVISAFAHDARSKVLFADARPIATREGALKARVVGVENLGQSRFRVDFEWQVLAPTRKRWTPFVHFTNPTASNENIAFQAALDFSTVDLSRPGVYRASAVAALPEGSDGQTFAIRFGLYDLAGGDRLPIASPSEGSRVKGGVITALGGNVSYQAEVDPGQSEFEARQNRSAQVLDFGAVQTNGALRLVHAGSTWTLMPLPFSGGFEVQLDGTKLGAGRRKIARITARGEDGSAGAVRFQMSAARVKFDVGAGVKSVRIEWK